MSFVIEQYLAAPAIFVGSGLMPELERYEWTELAHVAKEVGLILDDFSNESLRKVAYGLSQFQMAKPDDYKGWLVRLNKESLFGVRRFASNADLFETVVSGRLSAAEDLLTRMSDPRQVLAVLDGKNRLVALVKGPDANESELFISQRLENAPVVVSHRPPESGGFRLPALMIQWVQNGSTDWMLRSIPSEKRVPVIRNRGGRDFVQEVELQEGDRIPLEFGLGLRVGLPQVKK